jgi:superfamily II DNA or RNA helicase
MRIATRLDVPFAAGDLVWARGDLWSVEEATPFADCTLLHLAGAGAANMRRSCRLLHPFDRPALSATPPRIRAVTRRRWKRHLEARLAGLRKVDQLRAAGSAAIDILPFQLEPALALTQGRASRFLLADEVGLGKTIQAGLMLAELRHRGWCERALILTPAGLRRQWAEELGRRFNIRAAVIDTPALAALTAALPFGVNPWGVEPVSITSIDFVKQPEILRALTSQLWDMLIIDEAHQVPTAPFRAAAVSALAERARHVVLLTATPHAGNEPAYRSLCALGQIDRADPLLLFRRTRNQVGLRRMRRVHLLPVRLTPDALEMHRRLDDYVRRLWQIAWNEGKTDVQLVAMVLSKRAFSSAASLAISIQRRLDALAGRSGAPVQSPLPFDTEEDPSDQQPPLGAPAFDRPDEEEAMLRGLLAAADRARASERKLHALERLLRRAPEPAIVFTEYRDTLEALALALKGCRRTVVLHGGLTHQERRASVEAFTSGVADLLLATDAGSEGLNLQSRCRLVINLELPWNPIRLEQRIGRVDRIGQSRTVHAVHLFGQGTSESTVLANLVRRLGRIRSSEIEIASCVINRTDLGPSEPEPAVDACSIRIDLGENAESETARLLTKAPTDSGAGLDHLLTPVTILKCHKREIKTPSVIWFMRARIVNGAGRLVEETLVPVLLPSHRLAGPADGGHIHSRPREVRAYAERLIARFEPAVTALVRQQIALRVTRIAEESAGCIARALERERHMAKSVADDRFSLVQAGLFDNRALRHDEAVNLQRRLVADESAARHRLLEAGSVARLAQPPEISLLLITC